MISKLKFHFAKSNKFYLSHFEDLDSLPKGVKKLLSQCRLQQISNSNSTPHSKPTSPCPHRPITPRHLSSFTHRPATLRPLQIRKYSSTVGPTAVRSQRIPEPDPTAQINPQFKSDPNPPFPRSKATIYSLLPHILNPFAFNLSQQFTKLPILW